ncbi:hypothetical protein GF339_22120 [candidate division KSB3 bacterium]|uniref:FecR protein domain-containing protein n=1 Tax=candidate division KSB3 bacterium TaxID=2044937 RepID=A0A9D5Q7W3_9BACT|nr:hypothetical protein [candidate division KSB3 bacterium]MBD3327299.1 hypothetical protein [candidate division KSB3 bacterium]
MKRNTQRRGSIALILIAAFLVIGGLSTPGEAVLRPQTITGDVEKGMPWVRLEKDMALQAGDQIRTKADSEVSLLSEDGSVFYIGENTELAIQALEFSEPQKTRVSRIKLLWGALTAKASTLSFSKNEFSVETDTVVAGFKFSSARFLRNDQGTEIYPIEGTFEFTTSSTIPPGQRVVIKIGAQEIEMGPAATLELLVEAGRTRVLRVRGMVMMNGQQVEEGQEIGTGAAPTRALREEMPREEERQEFEIEYDMPPQTDADSPSASPVDVTDGTTQSSEDTTESEEEESEE